MIESFNKLKVLVIGETIIDQYYFCEAMGKSGKEPVLVLRDINMEQYAGGSAAIAEHLSSFCKSVTLLSMLGEKRIRELPQRIYPKILSMILFIRKAHQQLLKKDL